MKETIEKIVSRKLKNNFLNKIIIELIEFDFLNSEVQMYSSASAPACNFVNRLEDSS